jgi:hypothetical protein
MSACLHVTQAYPPFTVLHGTATLYRAGAGANQTTASAVQLVYIDKSGAFRQ